MRIDKILITALTLGCFSVGANAQTSNSQELANNIYTDVKDLLRAQHQVHKNARFAEDNLAYDVQMKALSDYAKQLAMQSAIRSGAANINTVLQKHSRQLDAIYNFQPLMIHSKVVPPVVTEAVDLFNQNGDMQIRLTDKVYDIISQAKITSTPPNWRDYLQFSSEEATSYDDDIFMTAALTPKTSLERQIWEKATKEGWQIGMRQANTLLLESLDRLNRDYIGMIRFHQLVAEGRLDMPAISSYELYENTDGARLLIGEKLFQITSLPQFKKAPSDIKKIHNGNLATSGYVSQQPDNMVEVQTDAPLVQAVEQPVITQVQKAVNDAPTVNAPIAEFQPTQVIADSPYVRSVINRRIIEEVAAISNK